MVQAIQFSSFKEFFDMGGYAFNVWSVYLIFAIFIAINIILPIIRREKIIKELKRHLEKNLYTERTTERIMSKLQLFYNFLPV